ncbi:MAG TPA: penicillin-binding transpeptidase domain-containing protein, partial [Candidatus Paceibacterota bacterium]
MYATAFAKGYTPEAVIFDLETQFHSGCDSSGKPLFSNTKEEECYMPQNYDEVFRGPVSLRNALAQSINIPALKVLYLVGIKDALETARNVGITSLTDPERYGLTLVLGGGEVSLLELTSAYSVFANEGVRNPHNPILSVLDKDGKKLIEFKQSGARAIDENIALQVSDVLSDNKARAPAFGERSFLYFENRDVAVKTGTTNDYRDAWIVGYTPNLAVGMWAGNNDNTPMEKKVAGFIIAPVWNAFLAHVLEDLPREEFRAPEADASWNSLKPLLRGVWTGGESYFVDRVSQKLATAFTPQETREERFVSNIHSELYWINKNDPRG